MELNNSDDYLRDENMPEIPQDAVIDKPVIPFEKLQQQELSRENIRELIATMQSLEFNMHNKPLPQDFKRVRIEKLIVPNSFDEHVIAICAALNIRPSTFYQGLMMDAMEQYITKINETLSDVEYTKQIVEQTNPENKTRLLTNLIEEEMKQLNQLVKDGKYDETLSPADNLRKFYGEKDAAEGN